MTDSSRDDSFVGKNINLLDNNPPQVINPSNQPIAGQVYIVIT